jgi:capsular polysaccharide export protein
VVAAATRGILRRRYLSVLLADWGRPRAFDPNAPATGPHAPDYVAGWGHKPTAAKARAWAQANGVPYLALEDGLIRSFGLGVAGEDPLSLVVDDLGIYYDASRPSRLEQMLAHDPLDAPDLLGEADALIDQLRRERIGKYNAGPPPAPSDGKPRVAVLDQTLGDSSIAGGLADASTFESMLDAALRETRHAEVVVRTHPDVVAGKRTGYLLQVARRRGVRVLADASHWPALCTRFDRVYAATSGAGLEALVQGVPVTCFGVPFYAGWGLTDDRGPVPDRRGRSRTLSELVAAAYLRYPVYVDPVHATRCSAATLVARIADRRQRVHGDPRPVVIPGMRRWKRNSVAPYFGGRARITFTRTIAGARRRAKQDGGRMAIWSARVTDELAAACARDGVELVRIEDGFLRSKGLGSNYLPAASLVLDDVGMYYDARHPSALEAILQGGPFGADERARAAALRQRIVAAGVTKYMVGQASDLAWLDAARADGQRVVLAPGQVPGDASLRFGAPAGIARDPDLLAHVRSAEPDALLVYKPHPDVLSGNRAGDTDCRRAQAIADATVTDAPMPALFDRVDAVHTMTSLAGFEALLRDVAVTAWGRPFYAGWGLTTDMDPIARRSARLTLDDLVAGTLLRYPRYHDWDSGYPCQAEDVAAKLADGGPVAVPRSAWTNVLLRRALRRLAGSPG